MKKRLESLYKSQRKEALNKLALVETNLNRVTDVIEEVGRQINSLKRQASKALRYRRIEHRYKHLDLAYRRNATVNSVTTCRVRLMSPQNCLQL